MLDCLRDFVPGPPQLAACANRQTARRRHAIGNRQDRIRVTANHPRALRLAAFLVTLVVLGPGQPLVRAGQATTPPGPKAAEPAQDPLGRRTPRGTVLGFLSAARDGDDDLARHYLNTTLASDDAAELAHQLYVVLDTRLPARLTQIDDTPEGSRTNPRALNEERIGTIQGPDGAFDVIVERVSRPKGDPVWLFSAKTLGAIPEAFADVEQSRRTMSAGVPARTPRRRRAAVGMAGAVLRAHRVLLTDGAAEPRIDAAGPARRPAPRSARERVAQQRAAGALARAAREPRGTLADHRAAALAAGAPDLPERGHRRHDRLGGVAAGAARRRLSSARSPGASRSPTTPRRCRCSELGAG